jgi:hypothetical protein
MTLPAAEDDRVVAFARDNTTPTSIASTLSQLTTSMQRAVSGMNPDNLTLELDASPDRLRVRLRAYPHRNGSG